MPCPNCTVVPDTHDTQGYIELCQSCEIRALVDSWADDFEAQYTPEQLEDMQAFTEAQIAEEELRLKALKEVA